MKVTELDLIIIPYHSLPCSYEKFMINGIDADRDNFGSMEDLNPDKAERYGCGNMQFVSKMPTDEVLKMYSINLQEYSDICDELTYAFSIGECGWCI